MQMLNLQKVKNFQVRKKQKLSLSTIRQLILWSNIMFVDTKGYIDN